MKNGNPRQGVNRMENNEIEVEVFEEIEEIVTAGMTGCVDCCG